MFKLLEFTCLFLLYHSISSSVFDWQLANATLWLSSAAYCETTTYLNRTYLGYSNGFVPYSVISEPVHDVQGFVGYHELQQAIYVVFRGSTSAKDWEADLDAILTSYPICKRCEVHKGFYNAESGIISTVIQAVDHLRSQFPKFDVVVTGHSLGAALATLVAVDLKLRGIDSIKLVNFGSPRISNTEFAEFVTNALPFRHRITHHKDIVPHCPMHERFTHIAGEFYEDPTNSIRDCYGYEDDHCAYQWHVTSIDDHMNYLGLHLGCASVSSN